MGKRHLAGESVAFQHFTANGGSGLVAFAGVLPGHMRVFELDGTDGWFAEKDAFVAAESTVNFDIEFRGGKVGRKGGEGFVLEKFTGVGTLVIAGAGNFIELNPAKYGGKIQVDTGCVVAFQDTITYGIERVGGLNAQTMVTAMFGGEGLNLATLEGDGTVILQSMTYDGMANALFARRRPGRQPGHHRRYLRHVQGLRRDRRPNQNGRSHGIPRRRQEGRQQPLGVDQLVGERTPRRSTRRPHLLHDLGVLVWKSRTGQAERRRRGRAWPASRPSWPTLVAAKGPARPHPEDRGRPSAAPAAARLPPAARTARAAGRGPAAPAAPAPPAAAGPGAATGSARTSGAAEAPAPLPAARRRLLRPAGTPAPPDRARWIVHPRRLSDAELARAVRVGGLGSSASARRPSRSASSTAIRARPRPRRRRSPARSLSGRSGDAAGSASARRGARRRPP